MIHEVIIIGSGPSGVASAFGFAENGIVPLILDVGYEARVISPIQSNFYDYRKEHNVLDIMVGEKYEGLQNVINKRTPSPKVSSPYMQFVTKDAERLSPIDEEGSSIIQSFAMGGLANAWGASLYRCLDDELVNLPIKASDLSPYYDKLTKEIGISGAEDDLTPFFGSTSHLLEPLKLSQKSQKLLSIYQKKKKKFNSRGIYMGMPRLCVLSRDYQDRTGCDYHNLELWFPNLPYIYTPMYTLKKLIKSNQVIYHKSVLVKSWSREDNHLVVHAENVDDGTTITFKCKKLLLAAGTINTSKIVLNTKRDFKTKLPLLDNSLVQIPLIFPTFVGSKLDKEAFSLTNLNIVFNFEKFNLKLQGSIIELTSPARAGFYEMLPFSARDNISLIRNFLPAVLVLFLYFPSDNKGSNYVMLMPDNKLEVKSFPRDINKKVIREVISTFIGLGVFTHSLFVKPPAHSIHYGGTLPMVKNPNQEYQCNELGELYQEPGVYIVDGSLFSYIPSKNVSFTLMANAMRIAENISKTMTLKTAVSR